MSVPSKPIILLTAGQIRDLHSYIGDMEDEAEVAISHTENAWKCTETEEFQAPGFYAWDTEYPEEGIYGPLGTLPECVRIIVKDDDAKFKAGTEVFPFEEKHPEKRERMTWDEFTSLASCRTPAFNAAGEGHDGKEIILPFRFLNEFFIKR